MMVMAKRKAAKRKRRTFPKPERQTVPLADAISEAYSELTSLAEEMRSWADNMEEKLSHTDKYETVNGTADILENLSEPEVPKNLQEIKVTFLPLAQRAKPYTRADQCGQACYVIEQCMEALEAFEGATDSEAAKGEAEELRSTLEQAKDEADSADFPGMY